MKLFKTERAEKIGLRELGNKLDEREEMARDRDSARSILSVISPEPTLVPHLEMSFVPAVLGQRVPQLFVAPHCLQDVRRGLGLSG